jgi:uncharacterized membrane protein YeaQ/YmgE (transglycosylase-associated protein family)
MSDEAYVIWLQIGDLKRVALSPSYIPGRLKMDWLITLIIGGVVGWLASLLMKSDAQMGLIANVLVGIVGSLLGYWLAGLLGVAATGGFVRWVVAVAGAALLIFILRAVGVFGKRA